jgi:nitrogen fixation NifU-like protein
MSAAADETGELNGELYRELIADHAKTPRNFREMPDADRRAEGHNKLCGDKLTVWVRVVDGVLADVSFVGSGCSISTSSASMMTEAMKGKTVEEAKALFERFHGMLTGPSESTLDMGSAGKLAAFTGVKRFPIRVKCATLPWHTWWAAMESGVTSVSMEEP